MNRSVLFFAAIFSSLVIGEFFLSNSKEKSIKTQRDQRQIKLTAYRPPVLPQENPAPGEQTVERTEQEPVLPNLDPAMLKEIQKIRKEVGISVFPIEGQSKGSEKGGISSFDPFAAKLDQSDDKVFDADFQKQLTTTAKALESRALKMESKEKFQRANELRILANQLRSICKSDNETER